LEETVQKRSQAFVESAELTDQESILKCRLMKKLSTAAAAREASLAVLRQRRVKGLNAHPFYWAGFVAAGDWHYLAASHRHRFIPEDRFHATGRPRLSAHQTLLSSHQ
jgi:hypothetical protein